VVVAVAAIVARRPAEPTAAEELRQRLDRAEEPARFSLDHRRGGTRVLDCMLPNTRFSIDVDTAARTMAVRREDGDLVALVDPDMLRLGRDLFRDPPFTSPWLAVPRDASASTIAGARRVLGADLAGYLLAPEVPATGRATAVAALDAAATVERTVPLREHGARADGYRLRIDPERFAAATLPDAATPTTTSSAAVPVPLIDLWVTGGGMVVRIRVRSADERRRSRPARGRLDCRLQPTSSGADSAARARGDHADGAGRRFCARPGRNGVRAGRLKGPHTTPVASSTTATVAAASR